MDCHHIKRDIIHQKAFAMTRLFLLPLIPALIWYVFLLYNRIPIRRGAKVFYWIIGLGWGLAAFLSLMMFLTR
ncbi:hypothetical protein C7H85_17105 [Zobellella endophytica]|uniref:Uncharacterized protein n=2 Tax=Zobellella endophytica TaxID=2116700 RepID=A0A2P7QXJ4_9GAMM|nr:hypothetical protein C7H85_17105 [Zobellella endophytica]